MFYLGAGINHFRRKDSLEGSLLGEEVSGGLLFGFFAAAAVCGGAVAAADDGGTQAGEVRVRRSGSGRSRCC